MDVGRAFLDRLQQQCVDEADDRRIVPRVEHVVDRRRAVGQRRQIGLGQFDIGGGRGAAAIARLQRRIEPGIVQRHERDAWRDPLHLQHRIQRRVRPVDALHARLAQPDQHAAFTRITIGQAHRFGVKQRVGHGWNSTVALTRPDVAPRCIVTRRTPMVLVDATAPSHVTTAG